MKNAPESFADQGLSGFCMKRERVHCGAGRCEGRARVDRPLPLRLWRRPTFSNLKLM